MLAPSVTGDIDQQATNGIYHYIDDLMPQTPQPAVQNVPQSAPAAPAPAPTGSRPLL